MLMGPCPNKCPESRTFVDQCLRAVSVFRRVARSMNIFEASDRLTGGSNQDY